MKIVKCLQCSTHYDLLENSTCPKCGNEVNRQRWGFNKSEKHILTSGAKTTKTVGTPL